MKQLASFLVISFLILLVIGGGCGFSGYKIFSGILNNNLSTSPLTLRTFTWCFNGLPFVDRLPEILNNKNFIVLLQNNMELRPSGGFLGSYALLKTFPRGISDIQFQDIYVPDGQLIGHVDPPLPIEQAFGQGWWKLRDSNWDPDFRIAGEQVAWFFEQGNEKVDGLVAINLGLVTEMLKVLGPVQPLDYSEMVSDKTIYTLAQKYADHNSFPGSTQKKDYLGAVGRALILKIKQASPSQLLSLGKMLFWQLKNNQILLWFRDPDLEKTAGLRKWDGGLNFESPNFLYIVETNLGANKANCCVTRQVSQNVTVNSDSNWITNITWKNESEFENPVKPLFWGGNYIDYVRAIIPVQANVLDVNVNGQKLIQKELDNQYLLQSERYQIEKRDNIQIIGFWAIVPAQKSTQAVINYQLSTPHSPLLIRRQPGIVGFNYKLIVNGNIIFDQKIFQDTLIQIDK